jgi:GNAT superfamily N-acetyltransferase
LEWLVSFSGTSWWGKLAVVIEQVDRDEILPVRHAVLRPNLPIETAMYAEDAHPEVFHLAGRDDIGEVVACVTFFPDPLTIPTGRGGRAPVARDVPAWRFRGMATLPDHRNRGLGGELLQAGVIEATRRGARLIWCNGRSGAKAFYLRHGFTIRSEEFEIPPIGPHYVFVRLDLG